MRMVMINCKDYAALVSERMDRPLSILQRLTLRLHEWLCPPCRHLPRQLSLIRQCCRWMPEEEPLPEGDLPTLPPDVAERMKCTLRQCAQNLPTERSGDHRPSA